MVAAEFCTSCKWAEIKETLLKQRILTTLKEKRMQLGHYDTCKSIFFPIKSINPSEKWEI